MNVKLSVLVTSALLVVVVVVVVVVSYRFSGTAEPTKI
jgi:hypothetical protein